MNILYIEGFPLLDQVSEHFKNNCDFREFAIMQIFIGKSVIKKLFCQQELFK